MTTAESVKGPVPTAGGGMIAIAVACSVLLGSYLLTMPKGYVFGDPVLLLAACASLSPAQPPGYPLYVLTCAPFAWLAGLLQFNPEQGAALASALAAAAACALMGAMLVRSGIAPLVAAVSVCTLGLSQVFWSQAVIQQVHALNALLFVASLFLVDRYCRDGGRANLVGLSLALGLGLSNNWPVFVLTMPAALLWLVPARRRLASDLAGRASLACAAAFLLGLAPYLLVAFGQRIFPTFPIGSPPAGFWQYVLDGPLDAVIQLGQPPRWDERQLRALSAVLQLLGGHTLLGGLLALVGLVVLARRWSAWILAALAWGMLSVTYATGLFRPAHLVVEVADELALAHSMAAAVTLTIPMAFGLAWAVSWLTNAVGRRKPQAAVVAPYLALLLPVAAFVVNHGTADRSKDDFAPMYADHVFTEVDPSWLLLVGSDSTDYPLLYDSVLRSRKDAVATAEMAEAYLDRVGPRPTIDQLGTYLGREEQDVAITTFVPYGLSEGRFHGFYVSVGDFGLEDIMLTSEKARSLIAHVSAGRDAANSALARDFVDQVVYRYALYANLLRSEDGYELPAADESLVAELADAPGFRFANYVLGALELVARGDAEAMGELFADLGDLGDLPLRWQVEAMNIHARALALDGRFEQARDVLKQALAANPSTHLDAVPVGLLALYAQEGEFEEYARLRGRYPNLDPRLLAGADRQCSSNLGRSCAP